MTSGASAAASSARSGRAMVAVTAATAAAIDLAAKAAAEGRLADSTVDLGPLQLRLAYNSGMAFSMGDRLPVGVIVAITVVVTVGLVAYAWGRAPHAGWIERAAGGVVVGGAVANVVDRTGDGVVTDYLATGWWPIFNLADAFLVTGFIVIALVHARAERSAGETEGAASEPSSRGR